MKEELKTLIMCKWAEDGLTCEDVKKYIKNDGIVEFKKEAADLGQSGFIPSMVSFYTRTAPVLSFGIPLAAGAALYLATHPGILRQREREEQLAVINDAIEKVEFGAPLPVSPMRIPVQQKMPTSLS